MSNNFLIYKITSPSGKSYIGQTKKYNERIRAHVTRRDKHPLTNAIKKYGWESFKLEILMENLNIDVANYWEEFYIRELDTLSPNGYNLHTGGRNHTVSEATRIRMKIASSGSNNNMFGKVHTIEAKNKISNKNRGKKHSIEFREIRSKLYQGYNNPFFGKKHSNETKKLISKIHLGKTISKETRQKLSNTISGSNHWNYGKHHSIGTRLKISNTLKNKIDYTNIVHISLDFWNTLVNPNLEFSEKRTQFLADFYNVPFDIIKTEYTTTKKYFDTRAEQYGEGYSTNDVYKFLLNRLGKPYEYINFIQDEINKIFHKHPPNIIPLIIPLIRDIQSAGITFNISSNTNFISGTELHKFLNYSGIYPNFGIYSDLVLLSKPNSNFYKRVYIHVNKLHKPRKLSKVKILHIGDIESTDGGAAEYGFKTVIIKNYEFLLETLNNFNNKKL